MYFLLRLTSERCDSPFVSSGLALGFVAGWFLGWNSDNSSAFLLGLLLLHSVDAAVDSASKLLPTFCNNEGSPSPHTGGCFTIRGWSCFNQILGKDAVNPYNTSQYGI